MIALVAISIAANLFFALRILDVTLRSRAKVEPCEAGPDLPSLSIVVPARNEARCIEGCVESLLAQRHPDFEVVVVDDCSEDATRSILERIAVRAPRLKIVAGKPLAGGWVGKPWALAQGASAARGRWLLFTDADTEHEPLAAGSAQRYALAGGFGVVSLLTDQQVVGWAERAFLPTILLAILVGIGATDDVNDPRKPGVALFNGQYILVSRDAYDAIGGHASVRGEIAEDLELARRFKRDGRFRICLIGAQGLARTRMYRSFAELWCGFVKNFALGARPLQLLGGLALLACLSPGSPLLFLWLLAHAAWPAAALCGAAIAAATAAGEFGMRRSRFPAGSGLWLPAGLCLVLAILATSLMRFASGRGVDWRGRRYGGGFSPPR